MKTIAFFNNISRLDERNALLVSDLAWMFCDLGQRVLMVDLDPALHLTNHVLDDSAIDAIWLPSNRPQSVLGAMMFAKPENDANVLSTVRNLGTNLSFIAGDPALGRFEDSLSQAWKECMSDDPAAAAAGLRSTSIVHRVIELAAKVLASNLVLINLGSNLDAINRAALVAADYVIIPLADYPISRFGLSKLGPTLRKWRQEWQERKHKHVPQGFSPPLGCMEALGYVLVDSATRGNRPVRPSPHPSEHIATVYSKEVLGQDPTATAAQSDPNQLAILKHFKSLVPMAHDARKPMFHLTPADGAIGGHAAAVQDCKSQYKVLAERILERANIG